MSENNAVKPSEIDWSAVRIDWQGGDTFRSLGAKYGTNAMAIQRRQKAENWIRPRQDVIAKKAREANKKWAGKLAKAEDRLKNQEQDLTARERLLRDRYEAIVAKVRAETVEAVRLRHRSEIRRAMDLCHQLMSEVEGMTMGVVEMDAAAEILTDAGQVNQRVMSTFHNAISLTGRMENLKKAVDVLSALIRLEREANDIVPPQAPPAAPVDHTALLALIAGSLPD